jgi:hypothetical protein
VKKVLESAIANAEHNEGADVDELKVSTIYVDEGTSLKRIMPRAKGRADRITKRTCHITVKVSEKWRPIKWVRKFIQSAYASVSLKSTIPTGMPVQKIMQITCSQIWRSVSTSTSKLKNASISRILD